jgi:hypothetical protein
MGRAAMRLLGLRPDQPVPGFRDRRGNAFRMALAPIDGLGGLLPTGPSDQLNLEHGIALSADRDGIKPRIGADTGRRLRNYLGPEDESFRDKKGE